MTTRNQDKRFEYKGHYVVKTDNGTWAVLEDDMYPDTLFAGTFDACLAAIDEVMEEQEQETDEALDQRQATLERWEKIEGVMHEYAGAYDAADGLRFPTADAARAAFRALDGKVCDASEVEVYGTLIIVTLNPVFNKKV